MSRRTNWRRPSTMASNTNRCPSGEMAPPLTSSCRISAGRIRSNRTAVSGSPTGEMTAGAPSRRVPWKPPPQQRSTAPSPCASEAPPDRRASGARPLRLNPLQLHLHVVRRLPAIGRRLREASLDDVVERGRSEWRERRHAGRFGLENLCDEARLRRAPRTPGGRSPSRAGWCPARRGRCARRLARPAPARAPCTGRVPMMVPWAVPVPGAVASIESASPAAPTRVLGQAEVEQLGARRGEHDVSGLRDPGGRCRAGAPSRARRRSRFRSGAPGEWQRPPLDTCGERFSFEEFEHEILGVVIAADVVQAADVRVVERRDGLGLALEAGAELRVTREFRCEHLDGHLAVKARIARPIHLAHAPGADRARGPRRGRAVNPGRGPCARGLYGPERSSPG